jgi:hypothetical protein
MGRNDYSWVAEEKQKAMMRKLAQTPQPNWMQPTVAERFGVSYTGLGENGQLDRNAPAGMDIAAGRPHVYHEGELQIATPEGRAYINADIAPIAGGFAGPSTPVLPPVNADQQDSLRRAEQSGMMGFSSGGGIFNTVKNSVQKVAQTVQTAMNRLSAPATPNGSGQNLQGGTTPNQNPQQPSVSIPQNNGNSYHGNPNTANTTTNPSNTTKPDPIGPVNYNAGNLQFGREAEGQHRVDDMRREAVSERSFLEHQQAMRGTDANAAWAQQAMTKARQDEGINKFAAQYAQGADARNYAKAMDVVDKAIAVGDYKTAGETYAQFHPGVNMDFSNMISSGLTTQINNLFASGISKEQVLNNPALRGMAAQAGINDTQLELWVESHYVNADNTAMSDFKASDSYQRWSATLGSDAQPLLDSLTLDQIKAWQSGELEKCYVVFDKNGSPVGDYATAQEADAAAKSNGGSYGMRLKKAETEAERNLREQREEERNTRINETVTGLKNGSISWKDFSWHAEGYDSPEYQKLLNSGLPSGTGSQEQHGTRGGTMISGWGIGRSSTPGHTRYPQLENAKNNGTPVNIDGKLYYVESSSTKNGSNTQGSGYVTGTTSYVLIDPVSGNKITKTTSSKSGSY